MYSVNLCFLGGRNVAAHSLTFHVQYKIKWLFADLWSKDTMPHNKYQCMNQYYQGIVFSEFVDVRSLYSLPVCCNSLLANKRFFATFIALLMTSRLLMAIGVIPLYHTEKNKKTTFRPSIQFLLCRARHFNSVACTSLIMMRCKRLTCGVRAIKNYNSH